MSTILDELHAKYMILSRFARYLVGPRCPGDDGVGTRRVNHEVLAIREPANLEQTALLVSLRVRVLQEFRRDLKDRQIFPRLAPLFCPLVDVPRDGALLTAPDEPQSRKRVPTSPGVILKSEHAHIKYL